jgi:protein-tyrosine phosphatase
LQVSFLFFCMGNICRSPLAEGYLKKKTSHLNTIKVKSAGTHKYHIGSPPDPRSIALAKEFEIDISGYRASHLSQHDLSSYDFIYALDSNNLEYFINHYPSHKDKCSLITQFNPLTQDVPDPYYGDMSDFESSFSMIREACDNIIRQKLSFLEASL